MLKRIIDITASSVALVTLSPIFAVTAYKVKKNLGSPILFKQIRPGLHGKPFEMIKFRSMRDATDENGNLLPDSERLTPFGQRLRSTSLDELPELLNVLKGDMSIVGPRPFSMVYVPYYTDEEFKRHNVKPGITGLAQVNGRNNLSWEEKFSYDLEYIENQSILLDFKIIFKTLYKVLKSEGIGQGEQRPRSLHEIRTKTYR